MLKRIIPIVLSVALAISLIFNVVLITRPVPAPETVEPMALSQPMVNDTTAVAPTQEQGSESTRWTEVHFTTADKAQYATYAGTDADAIQPSFNIQIPKTYIYLFDMNVDYEDVRLSTQVVSYGQNTNYTTLVCRYDVDRGWYEFNVSNSGIVAVLRYDHEHGYKLIGEGGLQTMKRGDAMNEVTASCIGNELSIEVNGKLWRTFRDDTIHHGYIGVGAGSGTLYPVSIKFQTIDVLALSPATTILPTATAMVTPTDCTDWWDCAAKTPKPNDPRFLGWTRGSGKSGNVNDPYWQKWVWMNENDWRTERATIIWDYLCQIDGCPSERDLATLLFYQEGSILLDDPYAQELMVKAIKFKLSSESFMGQHDVMFTGDGVTMEDLSFFTPFFNPKSDGANFSDADWAELTTKPKPVFFELVDKWYADPHYPICGLNGEVVDHWWTGGEPTAGVWLWFYSVIDRGGNVILNFGS